MPAEDIDVEDLLADWERRGVDPNRCVYTGDPLVANWALDHAYPLRQPGRQAHGKKLAKARAAVTEALHVAEVMTKAASAEGVPETQIAADLGVDRMTIRKWLGK